MFSEKFKAWVVFVYLTFAVTYSILVIGNDLDGLHIPVMTLLLVVPIAIFLVQNTPYDSLPKQVNKQYTKVHYIDAEQIDSIWLPEGYQIKPSPVAALLYLEKRNERTGEWGRIAKLYRNTPIVVTEHEVYVSWNNVIVH